MIEDQGLILNPIIENEHYVLGGFSGVADRPVLLKGGHGWGKYKPSKEIQKQHGLETMACTNYGTHNCLESLASFHGFNDFPRDCSERYIGVISENTRQGNDPHKVIEKIRQFGAVPEALLPWTPDIDSWDEFYHPNPMDENMVAMGQRLLRKFKISHEWVFNGSHVKDKDKKLIEALSRGTVALSVRAWKKKGTYYTKERLEQDNHWVQLLDYKEGKYWIVYDQYDPVEKKLTWDYNFFAAKIYYLERLPETSGTLDFFERMWKTLLGKIGL